MPAAPEAAATAAVAAATMAATVAAATADGEVPPAAVAVGPGATRVAAAAAAGAAGAAGLGTAAQPQSCQTPGGSTPKRAITSTPPRRQREGVQLQGRSSRRRLNGEALKCMAGDRPIDVGTDSDTGPPMDMVGPPVVLPVSCGPHSTPGLWRLVLDALPPPFPSLGDPGEKDKAESAAGAQPTEAQVLGGPPPASNVSNAAAVLEPQDSDTPSLAAAPLLDWPSAQWGQKEHERRLFAPRPAATAELGADDSESTLLRRPRRPSRGPVAEDQGAAWAVDMCREAW